MSSLDADLLEPYGNRIAIRHRVHPHPRGG
jgi:hypothetical protein